jgi:hypothetical protein
MSSSDIELWISIIGLILVFCIIFSFNACTAEEWNHGECPKCDVRYELRGVTRTTKYYACPECGNEVTRYLT